MTTDMPTMVNLLRSLLADPVDRRAELERRGWRLPERLHGPRVLALRSGTVSGGKLALTAIDHPPMQDPASFNLDAVKKKIDAMLREQRGQ